MPGASHGAARDDIPAAISLAVEAAVLALNDAHAAELSWLDPEGLSALIARAFHARVVGHAQAFLLAFDECADYDSPNYFWFRALPALRL